MLIKGGLVGAWPKKEIDEGEFKRKESSFRNWVTADGRPDPSGCDAFKAEPDRYHLYVSYACPWAHRTIIFRKLKKLEPIIDLSVVEADMLDEGWTFAKTGAYIDHLHGSRYLREIYTRANHGYSGQLSVPVLWDKKIIPL